MEKITSLEQAQAVISALQQQVIDVDTIGKEYELQLEQTVEVLKQEMELMKQQHNDEITKLEIQADELQEQNRQWESKCLNLQEENRSLLQDKLILQCELEQVQEEVARLKMDVNYEVMDVSLCRDENMNSMSPEATSEHDTAVSISKLLSLKEYAKGSSELVGNLPNRSIFPILQPIRVMFRGPSLFLQSMITKDTKTTPSLSQTTVVASTSVPAATSR
ncbi:HFL147Cp [Eremothecium sinecaudum]|uniref:HFL147Cp n=1 Tax=Eremothecium sinecaudum TaxID=45286 RepID=A0A0X8HUH3_9SACH|nr:HFL147Cp [Eremothecium sinecaudum]AMD21709.1 HFL147Cp [Eremothecium sinecaudum]